MGRQVRREEKLPGDTAMPSVWWMDEGRGCDSLCFHSMDFLTALHVQGLLPQAENYFCGDVEVRHGLGFPQVSGEVLAYHVRKYSHWWISQISFCSPSFHSVEILYSASIFYFTHFQLHIFEVEFDVM